MTRPELDYGPTGDDIRHKVAMNIQYQIPFALENPVLRAVLGGWQVNTITFYQTGSPFNVTCPSTYPTCDFNGDGVTGDRVNAPTSDLNLGSKTKQEWLTGAFKLSDFSFPAAGSPVGSLPRNSLRGPRYFNSDLSLLKNFEIGGFGARKLVVQVRLEAFNVFNQVNLGNPSSSTTSTTFGRVTSTRAMRVIQLGARVSF